MTQPTSTRLITVSREFGSGGSDLAQELGARFTIDLGLAFSLEVAF